MEHPKFTPTPDELAMFKKLHEQYTEKSIIFNKRQNELFAEGDGFFSKELLDNLEKAETEVKVAISEGNKFIAFMRSKYFPN